MWTVSWEKQRDELERIGNGITLIGGGDFNKLSVHPFTVGTKFLDTRTIDKLFIVQQKGRRVSHDGVCTDTHFFSDHNLKFTEISWRLGAL
jgi:hypothetical protein